MLHRIELLRRHSHEVQVEAAELERATAGMQSLHVPRPDEALMASEDAEDVAGMVSACLPVERQEAMNALFSELLRVPRVAEVMGWAVWALLWQYDPAQLPCRSGKRGTLVPVQARQRMLGANVLPLGDVHAETVVTLLRLMRGRYAVWHDAVKIGRRALCVAYIFAPGTIKNKVLGNLTKLGQLYGTTAGNPRATPGAAVDRMRRELVEFYVRTGGREEDVAVPGAKSQAAKERYAQVQTGNANKATWVAKQARKIT